MDIIIIYMENCFKTVSDLENSAKKREKPGLEFVFYLGGHDESNCGVMEVSAYAASALPVALQRVGPCK